MKSIYARLSLGIMIAVISIGASLPVAQPGLALSKGPEIGLDGNGTLIFVGTQPDEEVTLPGSEMQSLSPENGPRAALRFYEKQLGLQNADGEMALFDLRESQQGVNARFRQEVNGVPVFGAEARVNTTPDGRLRSLSAKVSRSAPGVTTRPILSPTKAEQLAINHVAEALKLNVRFLQANQAELMIFDETIFVEASTKRPELVWSVEIRSTDANKPARAGVMVNARSGEITLSYQKIDTVWGKPRGGTLSNAQPGSAPDEQELLGSPVSKVYTMNGSYNDSLLPGTLVCTETNIAGCGAWTTDARKAMEYALDTYDFYANNHSRDSIDNQGMTLISSVKYGINYQNAFWDGAQMVYGDKMVADDVVGHELTHGVTEYESGLIYLYQSGAINESLSDVWGEFVDLTNGSGNDSASARWLMGENLTGIGAIRNMKNPTQFGDPDRMRSPYYYTGTCTNLNSYCDNGGVHYNSGVNNKAVFLMTDGGSFNGYTITGIGIEKTAAVYYETQTNLLHAGSSYLDLYFALYQACTSLVGGAAGITTPDCTQVRNATLATEMNKAAPGNAPVKTPAYCPPGSIAGALAFEDGINGGTMNDWQKVAISGPQAWWLEKGGFDAQDGYSFFGNNASRASNSYIVTRNFISVPTNGYLFFNHWFWFEKGFDGGVVEYSTNGSTWLSLKPLLNAGQNYNGTITGGLNAFTGNSKGTTGSRYNLSSLAGSSIKLRWRIVTNSSIGAPMYMGWIVDKIRVYPCNP